MRTLLELISLISIGFIIIIAYSFSELELSIFGVEIRKSNAKAFFSPPPIIPTVDSSAISRDSMLQDSILQAKKNEVKTDSNAQRILLIGDSMLEGLQLRMRDYSVFNEHEMKSVIWYSSTTEVYGNSDTIAHFIRAFQPSYIVIVLGSNEMFIKYIKYKRQEHVEHILAQIDSIPYVWVGPPNWQEDTGINDLILENVGKRRFFESRKLTFQRTEDGIHPTHYAARIWMDSIAAFIQTESPYRIRMNRPDRTYKKAVNFTLLSSGD